MSHLSTIIPDAVIHKKKKTGTLSKMCKAYGPISVKLQGWGWAQAGNLIAMTCLYSGIFDHYFFLVEFVTNLKTLKTL